MPRLTDLCNNRWVFASACRALVSNQTVWFDHSSNCLIKTIRINVHTTGFGWDMRKLLFWYTCIEYNRKISSDHKVLNPTTYQIFLHSDLLFKNYSCLWLLNTWMQEFILHRCISWLSRYFQTLKKSLTICLNFYLVFTLSKLLNIGVGDL